MNNLGVLEIYRSSNYSSLPAPPYSPIVSSDKLSSAAHQLSTVRKLKTKAAAKKPNP
jgi:hypothetical protein